MVSCVYSDGITGVLKISLAGTNGLLAPLLPMPLFTNASKRVHKTIVCRVAQGLLVVCKCHCLRHPWAGVN